ncbi:MAG: hypothetical protein II222_00750, partial [Paraprevotella sp.]|nr:hypothetical protein [Paraprevotella sp.]
LTCNKMTVEAVYGERERLMPALALCNNDSSPTELALTEYCPDCEELRARFPRKHEIPFDSAKKYMVTVNRAENGYFVYMKGAPDVVAGFCREALWSSFVIVRKFRAPSDTFPSARLEPLCRRTSYEKHCDFALTR